MRLDGGSPSSHHAKWSLPPGRERLDPSTALDHVAVRLLVLGMLFVGFCVRGFANLALDAMSLFIIESKGWIVFLLGQGVIIWLIRERRDRVPQVSSIRKLLMEANAGDACPVRIVVRQWGVVTGGDQGLAWIEGDRLIFKGSSTTFHPRRSEFPAWVLWSRRDRRNAGGESQKRRLPLPWGDQATLEIVPIDRYDDHAIRRRAANFDRKLDAWLKSSPTRSHERSLLPPAEIHPSLLTSPKFVWGTVVTTVSVCLLDLLAIVTPVSLDRHQAIFWVEAIMRLLALMAAALLLRECGQTVRTQTIRSYCLSRPAPETVDNRAQ